MLDRTFFWPKNLLVNNFFCWICYDRKYFWWTFFYIKMFLVKTIFHQIFLFEKFLCSDNCGRNIFWLNIFFFFEKLFSSPNCWQKFSSAKLFLGQHFVWQKMFCLNVFRWKNFCHIFFWTINFSYQFFLVLFFSSKN